MGLRVSRLLIDPREGVWAVPATRMKAKREHRVPLCGRAIDILDEARTFGDGTPIVFTIGDGQPIIGCRRRREGLRKTTQMTIRRCRMLHFVATARACANVLAAGNEAIWKYGATVRVRGAGLLTDGFELHPLGAD